MARVSVVIPTYNRAAYISEAIQSVLDQTYSDFEMIIVDDGSTDNTREIVGSFDDSRIKYIYQKNQRLPAARNTGTNASSGEYITFLDSDDILMENAVKKGVQILDEHPEVAFSYTPNYSIDERGQIIGLQKKGQKHSWVREGTAQIREFLIDGHHIGVCATMMRRSYLYEVGLWDTTYTDGSEDFNMLMRLARKYRVAYINESAGKVRVHQSSMTGTRDLNELEKTNSRIFESIFQDPEVGHLFSGLRSKAYFRLYLRLALNAHIRKDRKTSNLYFTKALKVNPKDFIKGLWFPWIYYYLRTLIPTPLKYIVRRVYHYLSRWS